MFQVRATIRTESPCNAHTMQKSLRLTHTKKEEKKKKKEYMYIKIYSAHNF